MAKQATELRYAVRFRVVLQTCLPKHAVIESRLACRRLQDEEIHAALLLILLFVAVVALSWLPFVAMGYSPLDSLFEVVSATGTVGLSVGLTSATLPGLLKGILCVDMLMGRHELGLKDTIIPSRTISRYLEDMVGGGENVELSTVIKDEARFFTLIAKEEDTVAAKDRRVCSVETMAPVSSCANNPDRRGGIQWSRRRLLLVKRYGKRKTTLEARELVPGDVIRRVWVTSCRLLLFIHIFYLDYTCNSV